MKFGNKGQSFFLPFNLLQILILIEQNKQVYSKPV